MRSFLSIALLLLFSALPSQAEPVCAEDSGGLALVVIDMQRDFVTRGGFHNHKKNIQTVDSIQKELLDLINRAVKKGIPVIFLEYEEHGRTDPDLLKAIGGYHNSTLFLKDTDGMFEKDNRYRSDLADYLKSRKIGHLIIAGANGGACVRSSIEGALENNCNVTVYNRGVADFNFPEFIYPYSYAERRLSDRLRTRISRCKNCQFRETSSVDEINQIMLWNSSQSGNRMNRASGATK